ncbi:MAG: HAD-IIIA family hydrolase [Candidatus Aminicenantes bacterium]|nr:HAD-IIIA family hydrolase [Candidatus Aminicenantes bacterium]
MNRAVFLDRDGTLNEDVGYPRSLAEIRIFPESFEAIRLLNKAGFHLIVVTNQSAVGRGWLAESNLQKIHSAMQEIFLAQGARIDAFYYCPHWLDSLDPIYALSCECRKPGTALGHRAARDFNLNLKKSFMVGDKLEDILFGHRLGTKSVLVLTGDGKQTWQNLSWLKEKNRLERINSLKHLNQRGWDWTKLRLKLDELEPDYVAANILEAAHWIINQLRNESNF